LGKAEEIPEGGCDVSKYQKKFISMDGKVFWADVYRVLKAFGVVCPAVQHAVKKLLMPGQRGAKGKLQDLEEALLSMSEAIAMARAELPEGDTLTGETEPEPETRREDAMPITDITSNDFLRWARGVQKTCRGGTLTGETEVEPEPMPEPKPKPKMVTWRLCVRITPKELDDGAVWIKWYPSGDIPEHWYPLEAQSQPIETIQQLPEGQQP
jgi:hypothetical protein